MTQSARDRVLLVTPTTRITKLTRRKQKLANELAQTHNMHRGAAVVEVTLTDPLILKPVEAIKRMRLASHDKLTVPYNSFGTGMLPSELFFAYTEADSAIRINSWEPTIAQLCTDETVERIRQAGRERMGTAFCEDDYPSAAELRKFFVWDLEISPFPAGKHLAVDLPDEVLAEISAGIEERERRVVAETTTRLFREFYATLEDSIKRISAFRRNPATGKIERTFFDSAIDSVREQVRLLPMLNLAGDPELNRMVVDVEASLCAWDADELKQDEHQRKTVVDNGERILRDMAAYLGGGASGN